MDGKRVGCAYEGKSRGSNQDEPGLNPVALRREVYAYATLAFRTIERSLRAIPAAIGVNLE
jgi:hypothetical protein